MDAVSKNTKVSVVIVSYNVIELLRKCLLSLVEFSECELDTWVVDNNSSDGSLEMVKENFPMVHVIENKYNAGFPAANNQALAKCTGDYIFLINPDAELLSDSISDFIKFSKTKHDSCIIAPQLLNTDRSMQFSIMRFIHVWEIVLEVFYLHHLLKKAKSYYKKLGMQPMKVEAVSGAAIFFHRGVMNKIGMLDEELFWTEDMEYCYRAYRNGIDRYYLPEVKIIHHVGQSGKKNLDVMISNQVLSKIRYFYKTHGAISGIIVSSARFIHIITRIVLLYVMSILQFRYSKKAHAYVFTLKRYLAGNF